MVIVKISGLPICGVLSSSSLANGVVFKVLQKAGIPSEEIASLIMGKETDGIGRFILVEVLDFRPSESCFFDRTFKPIRVALGEELRSIWGCPVFVRRVPMAS
ncbi:MAG: hypothetical protein Q8O32_00385 [bacterium]|nr:hypothetical protein [bacterium]